MIDDGICLEPNGVLSGAVEICGGCGMPLTSRSEKVLRVWESDKPELIMYLCKYCRINITDSEVRMMYWRFVTKRIQIAWFNNRKTRDDC